MARHAEARKSPTKRPELSSLVKELRALSVSERIAALAEALDWTHEERALLLKSPSLPHAVANQMVENSIGVLGIPLGVAGPFVVNGQSRLVPMATEEPSVIAAASLGAKLAALGGGFVAEADEPVMLAQVQLLDVPDAEAAAERILQQKHAVLELANRAQPGMQQRGGGAKDVEVFPHRLPGGAAALGVHLVVDVRDAMGANVLNLMAEAVAPFLETCSGGRAGARILSNFADRRRVRARCAIPVGCLETEAYSGQRIARGIVELSLFAEASVHRAVTHNKGIMNGIDAVALATGNDFRAIEAGAHAWASREGRYSPLATWHLENETLVGRIELPLQVGIVGASVRANPLVPFVLDRLLAVNSGNELAMIMAAVGLSQNLAALRALGSEGITRGHMALHHRRQGR